MSEPENDQSSSGDEQITDDERKKKEREERREFAAYWEEAINNNQPIPWKQWLTLRRPLNALEASCLICGLDPDSFTDKERDKDHDNDARQLVRDIRIIRRLAEADGKKPSTPAEWLKWATSRAAEDQDFPRTPPPAIEEEETAGVDRTKGPDRLTFAAFQMNVEKWAPDPDNAVEGQEARGPAPEAPDIGVSYLKNDTPGKMPRVRIGQLAVQAAEEIEKETGKPATARETMNKLREWAENKSAPELVGADINSVTWRTSEFKEKSYDLNACQKTLMAWNKSRR